MYMARDTNISSYFCYISYPYNMHDTIRTAEKRYTIEMLKNTLT